MLSRSNSPKTQSLFEHRDERIRSIAHQLYLNRQKTGHSGNAQDDWYKASAIHDLPIRRFLFNLNQPLIRVEKRTIEPIADWVDHADIFRIVERISPTIEALGVLIGAFLIPLVLFTATQNYQDQVIEREREYQESVRQQELDRLHQQALEDYFSQLSTILLELEGDFREPQNERLRTLTNAATLTLLREPKLDGYRKGQVIRFLSQVGLITADSNSADQLTASTAVTLNLNQSSLSGASLSGVDLRGASFEGANLSKADLNGADLRDADLTGADLSQADLQYADLRNANLSNANLSDVFMYQEDGTIFTYGYLPGQVPRNIGADLEGADLRGADLSNSSLKDVVLKNADLSDINIEAEALALSWLCSTKLPENINLDPNRDCSQLEELRMEQSIERAKEEWNDEEFRQRLNEVFSDRDLPAFFPEEDR